jgi:hypothetical protein
VPSWDDAIAVLPGECLALVNPDRQVHVLRAKAPLPPQFRANQPPLLGGAIGTGGAPASSAGCCEEESRSDSAGRLAPSVALLICAMIGWR